MNLLNDFGFAPDGARARALDHRMRQSLGASLAHIAEQVQGQIPYDTNALRRLLAALEAGARLPPSAFGLYVDLVGAICDDQLDVAASLFDELLRLVPQSVTRQLLAIDAPVLRPQQQRYTRLMGGEAGEFSIVAPSPEQFAQFIPDFDKAFALLRDTAPALAEEFDALVSEVVLVSSNLGADRYQFDGGSCYMLWGALFLNIGLPRSRVGLVEVLAHESAHMLLYGFAAEEALVENDDDERYPSPLRIDERPMDGIYHATYVSARMHWMMSHLLDSGCLDAASRAEAEAARADDLRNFLAGDSVVQRYGRLTATGDALMQAARAYINAA